MAQKLAHIITIIIQYAISIYKTAFKTQDHYVICMMKATSGYLAISLQEVIKIYTSIMNRLYIKEDTYFFFHSLKDGDSLGCLQMRFTNIQVC